MAVPALPGGLSRRDFLRAAAVGGGAVALVDVAGIVLRAGAGAQPSTSPLDVPGTVHGVAFGQDRAVAVGSLDDRSPASWVRHGSGAWQGIDATAFRGGALADVASVAGGFVAVGSAGRNLTSTPLTTGEPAATESESAPATDPVMLPTAWWSDDGTTWNPVALGSAAGHLAAVTARGDEAVAVGCVFTGDATEGTRPLVARSSGGHAWAVVQPTGLGELAEGALVAAALHDDRWYAAAATVTGSDVWSSPNGTMWQTVPFRVGEPATLAALVPSDVGLVAIGATLPDAQPRVWRSDSRVEAWTRVELPAALASATSTDQPLLIRGAVSGGASEAVTFVGERQGRTVVLEGEVH
ncbi:MAG: twin-arginine translocation signal domain-containing protein [Acidimicrobiales bacterium]